MTTLEFRSETNFELQHERQFFVNRYRKRAAEMPSRLLIHKESMFTS